MINQVGQFPVILDISAECRWLIEKAGGKIINTVGTLDPNIILLIVEYPPELEAQIADYAFMTWISNPAFQKYYLESKAWQDYSESKRGVAWDIKKAGS